MDNIEIFPIRKEDIIEREKIEAVKEKEEEEIENDENFILKEDESKKKIISKKNLDL